MPSSRNAAPNSSATKASSPETSRSRASTIVTTNLAFKDWGTLFHGAAAATAIADRLVHKGLLVRIVGDSVRPGTNGGSGNSTDPA